MEALLEWLRAGVPAGQLWLYIIGGIVITFVYDIATLIILKLLKIEPRPPMDWPYYLILGWKDVILIGFGLTALILFLIFAAAAEEFIFRLPLVAVTWLAGPSAWVILAAIILSLIFGLAHGGIINIFLQGIVGFFWCLLFLKCGGFQGEYLIAFGAVVIVHFVTNLILLSLDLLLTFRDWKI